MPHRTSWTISRPTSWAILAVTSLGLWLPHEAVAQGLPKIDLDFTMEHLFEVTMDSRFASVPTAAGGYDRGVWRGAMTAGWQTISGEGFDLEGSLVAGTLGFGFAPGRGIELTGFYDQASLSGGEREHVLRPLWSHDVPLDLPQRAEISGAGGDVTSWGVGVAYVRQLAENPRERHWTWRFGVLYDQLEVNDVRVHYRLLAGASAGAEGEVDYTASYSYITPWVEGEVRWPLGSRWEIAPHFGVFYPQPRRGFAGRITGSGFDISGDSAEFGAKPMGDPFVALGVRLDDRKSGFGIDLGATAFQAVEEGLIHEGIDTSILLLITWQPPRP